MPGNVVRSKMLPAEKEKMPGQAAHGEMLPGALSCTTSQHLVKITYEKSMLPLMTPRLRHKYFLGDAPRRS